MEYTHDFNYEECKVLINNKILILKENKDLIIDTSESNEVVSTIRARIQSSKYLGELIVWGSGMYSIIVLDLADGSNCSSEDQNNKLSGNGSKRIDAFFEYFREL